MTKPRLLIAYAHPDDETFGLGGLIAKYIAEGAEVYVICATNGDAGSMDEEFLQGGKTIKDVRLAELDAAAKLLNITEVFLLGYHDSGMMGSETNKLPDALWNVWHTAPDAVTRRVVEVMRQVRPHVVITFNEYGGYGHPDHIAIQQATVAAMQAVNDPAYITEGLPPYQPQKLYFSGIARLPVQLGIWMARLRGQNPRAMGRNKDIDIVEILDHVTEPTTRIELRDYLEIWDEANACHASQGGGRFFPLPMWLRRRLASRQGFTLVQPAPTRPGIFENDIFQGVVLEAENEAIIER